ncbi:MAG: molybdopterin-binding protein [Desulfovibrionaceae bacterium]|jgi:molybdate transport system regulatory protein
MYHSSARNAFFGSLEHVHKTPIMTEIRLRLREATELVAMITTESFERLAVAEGASLTAMVKAPDILVATEVAQPSRIGAGNRLPGRIDTMTHRGVSVEVLGELENGTPMCALCTAQSVADLGLREGDAVWFLFTAFSLIVAAA